MNDEYIYQIEYELQQTNKRQEMEKQLLERLNEGLLDGLIGNGFNQADAPDLK